MLDGGLVLRSDLAEFAISAIELRGAGGLLLLTLRGERSRGRARLLGLLLVINLLLVN